MRSVYVGSCLQRTLSSGHRKSLTHLTHPSYLRPNVGLGVEKKAERHRTYTNEVIY